MQKAWTPPWRWVFAAATVLGFFSALQSYRLSILNAKDPMEVRASFVLVLNLVYWYIPASLTSIIFRLASRFRVDGQRWGRALAVHALAAGAFSVVHFMGMVAIRSVLWPQAGKSSYASWWAFSQRLYLNNLDWTLMVYSTIVGLSYALTYYRESQARAVKQAQLETRLVEARLRTLEAELHPHFLFNTLHAISTLVHTSPDAADRMISRLSDLLRLTFDRSGASGVPLHDEIEFLQKYLEIEQTRFQDRLSVHFDIEPDTLDAEVPRLILQPLVENAIKHGVSSRTGHGIVQISSRRAGEALWLEVRDQTAGVAAPLHGGTNTGVGLSNTRDRLACLYGDAHRLEFSDQSDGAAVRIEIPFHRSASGSDAAAIRVA